MPLELLVYERNNIMMHTTLARLHALPAPQGSIFSGRVELDGKATNAELIDVATRQSLWSGTVGLLGEPDADINLPMVVWNQGLTIDIEMQHILRTMPSPVQTTRFPTPNFGGTAPPTKPSDFIAETVVPKELSGTFDTGATCPECNGTGEIVLFMSTVPCERCQS